MRRRVQDASCPLHEHRQEPNEKGMMCLTCHIALVSIRCHGKGLERRHFDTDWRLCCGDSTPLLIAKERRTVIVFAAAISMKGGGDPHAPRLLEE